MTIPAFVRFGIAPITNALAIPSAPLLHAHRRIRLPSLRSLADARRVFVVERTYGSNEDGPVISRHWFLWGARQDCALYNENARNYTAYDGIHYEVRDNREYNRGTSDHS